MRQSKLFVCCPQTLRRFEYICKMLDFAPLIGLDVDGRIVSAVRFLQP